MMQRRQFLATLCAGMTGALSSAPAWAAVGAPDFITAANRPDKSSWLVGLTQAGDVTFQIPIPGRGHAAATHPTRAEAVCFARRPGRFAVVLNCATGHELSRLKCPSGRHFYGHGAFSADGTQLFTTENDYDELTGAIGIWDVENQYARIGEVPSGGIGPHEILRRADGGFVVANGGIQTHPDMARTKLNLPNMRPMLTYLDADGQIEESAELTGEMHKNSIRHIALASDGTVLVALQWQGNPLDRVPMVARHQRGTDLELLAHPDEVLLKNYAGSIAVDKATGAFSVTGPKGGAILHFEADGTPKGATHHGTASGAAPGARRGLVFTCDTGLVHRTESAETLIPVDGDWSWDNHLIAV